MIYRTRYVSQLYSSNVDTDAVDIHLSDIVDKAKQDLVDLGASEIASLPPVVTSNDSNIFVLVAINYLMNNPIKLNEE